MMQRFLQRLQKSAWKNTLLSSGSHGQDVETLYSPICNDSRIPHALKQHAAFCRFFPLLCKQQLPVLSRINTLQAADFLQIGVLFGNPETTPGGLALKYYCSVRIDVRRIKTIEGPKQEQIGIRVKAKVACLHETYYKGCLHIPVYEDCCLAFKSAAGATQTHQLSMCSGIHNSFPTILLKEGLNKAALFSADCQEQGVSTI